MGDVQSIKHLHYSQGWSKKRIARELGLQVKTVRRVLRGEASGEYHRARPRARPVTAPIEPRIQELLETEAKSRAPRKQRLTAAAIEDILRRKHDYTGSDISVRRAVARVRRTLGDPLAGAMVPLAYDPGVDAQVDFLEGDVDYPDGRQRRHFLLVRACYSTKPFVYHAPAENQEALLDGLVESFEHFGGVFHYLWFDNLTLAVARVLKSRSREVQARFGAFAAHYGFAAEFCAVGKGNEKGGVENGVRYFQRRCLSPVPEVTDDETLTAWVRVWVAEQAGRQPAGRDRSIGALWAEEQPALMPLPGRRFDACQVTTRPVSSYSLVQDGTNFYSVPAHLANGSVTLKRYAWTVELHDTSGLVGSPRSPQAERGALVASHKRLYGRGRVSFELAHYLPLLERKTRAFDRAAPVKAVRASWPASYELLLRLLRADVGEAHGTREFIGVLKLHEHHPVGLVHEAVRRALTHEAPSLAAVRRELERLTGADQAPAPLPEDATAHLPAVSVADPDVAAYGQLYREAG